VPSFSSAAIPRRWSERDVSAERYAILFLDGFHLKVRTVRRVVSMPVLVVLGVAEDGHKYLVALQLVASEAGTHRSSPIADLQRRGRSWSTPSPNCNCPACTPRTVKQGLRNEQPRNDWRPALAWDG
jgi:hypothetical protein